MSLSAETRFMNQRAGSGKAYVPTECEHIANICTHGLWVLPSLAGMLWMLHLSAGNIQLVIAFVYGSCLFLLFAVSTTFHVLAYCGDQFQKLRAFFHLGDRAIIYIFIAASYTPWLTLKEHNNMACIRMLFLVWLLAVAGIVYQFAFHEKHKSLEIVFYLLIGVAPSVIVFEMTEHSGVHEMAVGGAIYISGIIFFKCDGVIPFAHAIWHCFVFLGALMHFSAVCHYLLSRASHHSDELAMQFTS